MASEIKRIIFNHQIKNYDLLEKPLNFHHNVTCILIYNNKLFQYINLSTIVFDIMQHSPRQPQNAFTFFFFINTSIDYSIKFKKLSRLNGLSCLIIQNILS